MTFFITALSADFSFSCDYAFLWLNKSRYASSSVKLCILVTTVKEAQIWNESMKAKLAL